MLHMPAVGIKTLRYILTERQIGTAVYSYSVIVIQINHFTQTQVTCHGSCFRCDPLHKIAIGDDGIGKMVDDIQTIPIEFVRKKLFRHGHADTIGKSLTKGASGGFHARRVTEFRMSRCFTPPLTEVFYIIKG